MTSDEGRFKNDAEERGHVVALSLNLENMFRKWDFLLDGNVKVDEKGLRRVRRTDKQKSRTFTWIEHTNVHGDIGSSLGDADIFAFEIDMVQLVKQGRPYSTWLLVPADAARALPVDWENVHPMPAYGDPVLTYTAYSRERFGRLDSIALVPISDLEKIAVDKWLPKTLQ